MEKWASSNVWPSIVFLCISVVGRPTALMFERSFGLDAVTNAYIKDKEHMPRFGQLGCSGFVVLDSEARVVSGATRAFLEAGEAAFRDLEVTLAHILDLDDDELDERQEAVATAARAEAPQVPRLSGAKLATASVRQLKDVMRQLGIDASGCLEKRDLLAAIAASDACEVVGAAEGCGAEEAAAVQALPSVGVTSMDEEHAECTQALEALAASQRAADLEQVINVFASHFSHEEELLAAHGFGRGAGTDDRFSAAATHAEDHARILRLARDALASLDCSEKVPAAVINAVASALHTHATKYDALYEKSIPVDAA
eukprot:scaffold53_cov193-Pinguiococcus_pyrenoidosus.AAC.13